MELSQEAPPSTGIVAEVRTDQPPRPRWLTLLSSLRAKLILPYVLLTMIIAMVGTFVVTQLVTSSFQERFRNQLDEASRVAADEIVRREKAQLANLRFMVFTEGVAQAITRGQAATLEDRLLPVALNYKVEAITAVNLQGRELLTLARDPATGQYNPSRGGDFSGYPVVANVLEGRADDQGDKFIGLLGTGRGLYLFTSAPVRDETGKLVGALMVGTQLDSLLSDLKAQVAADLIVLDSSGKFVATTLPDSGTLKVRRALELDPAQTADLGLSFIRTLDPAALSNRSYQAEYAPLIVRQQVAGVLAVVLPSNFILERGATSRNQISLIFALGTMAIIIVGYVLAQSIARPILRLRAVSQAVAAGDLNQSTGLRQSDEIGELASAFDVMTLKLRERTAEAARLHAETLERNEQLAQANAQLQTAQHQLVQSEKLAAVGQLTAGIVHDVKNPLAIIVGLAEELPEHVQLDPVAKKHLTTIRDSARRANAIVTDLLKFARESTPDLKRQDLRDTIETVLRLTDYLARKAKVQVVKDLPAGPVMILYDALQIEQVLMNLVQNAIQAMPNGGMLRVNLSQASDAVAIAVQDTGVGIPPKNLSRIFDPFFTTKPPGEGTGLGLSTSYGIVARHGGRIDVGSVVGEGTTFTILLSAAQAKSKGNGEVAE